MNSWLETAGLIVFLILTLMPGIYGVHMYALMFLTQRRLRNVRAEQREILARYPREMPDEQWPYVTTQLPIYNELAVARRVIAAAARMDYPAGRHEIQVLDDSTDETRDIIDQVCAELRAEGHDVKVVRRATRQDYKAGALAHGLTLARGEYIAVFDADFVPDKNFLRRLVPLLLADPQAGCAQGRWGHLNANESWMTEALALGIDGHFGVEQPARGWNGFLLNFNGSGGIWRRAAIEDPRVGGWQGDTLTEDLDLSYRAQLVGWKVVYCLDETCPAEIPATADAIKTQQRRWATGSIQTARKLLPVVWRSNLSLVRKIEATIHLTQYAANVFMVLMVLFGRPLLWLLPPALVSAGLSWTWVMIPLAAAAPTIAYIYARRVLGGGWAGSGRILKLMALGMGLSVNNSIAVLAGLLQKGGEFIRTPKSGSRDDANNLARRSPYAALRSHLWIFELALGLFCLAQWLIFLKQDRYVFGSFLLLYGIGLFLLGWASRPRSLPRAIKPPLASTPDFSASNSNTAAQPAMRGNL